MKLFSSILFSLVSIWTFAQQVYQSESFILHLKEDSSFAYYPKGASIKGLIAGDSHIKEDSLILTTHQYNGESAIFAIYYMKALELSLTYAQWEFRNSLPTNLYIHQTQHANNNVASQYYWTDYVTQDYSIYQFSPEGYMAKIEFFENSLLEGKQLYFYPTRENNIQMEAHYKEGKLHGNLFYYESLEDGSGKLALVKKEKYRNGKLLKSKTPGVPPTFYTARF